MPTTLRPVALPHETPTIAHPPETLEGWFALHQIFHFRDLTLGADRLARMLASAAAALEPAKEPATKARAKKSDPPAGWSCFARLIGSTADLMVIHFRDSLDAIGAAQEELERSELAGMLQPAYAFLSVTEAGLYHIRPSGLAPPRRAGKVDTGVRRALSESAALTGNRARETQTLLRFPADIPYVLLSYV